MQNLSENVIKQAWMSKMVGDLQTDLRDRYKITCSLHEQYPPKHKLFLVVWLRYNNRLKYEMLATLGKFFTVTLKIVSS